MIAAPQRSHTSSSHPSRRPVSRWEPESSARISPFAGLNGCRSGRSASWPTAINRGDRPAEPCVLIDRVRADLKRQVLSSAEAGPAFRCDVLGVVGLEGKVVAGDTARVRLPSASLRAYRPERARCTTPPFGPPNRKAVCRSAGMAARKSTLGAGEAIDGRGKPSRRASLALFSY